MVVRKGEKRERLEKRQQYHQRVSSSFHPQNHTERARSPSYSLLSSRSLLFSFALSLPLSLSLFLFFSLALSFSLSLSLSLSRSLCIFSLALSFSSSPPFSSSPRTSCTCTVLSIGSPGWQPASGSGARLAFLCPRGTFADTSGAATARENELLPLLAVQQQQQHRRDAKSWEQRTIHNHQHQRHLPRAWRRSPVGRRAAQCPSTSS